MLYTSLFVWEMSAKILGLVMWLLMGSVRGWFLDDRIAGNAWFYWEKMGICKEIFWIFYEDFLRKFCDFWSSSIEALFYKGWEVFWRYFWWFLTMLKWRKTLIFQCFVELITELENGGLDVKTSDMPSLASGCLL